MDLGQYGSNKKTFVVICYAKHGFDDERESLLLLLLLAKKQKRKRDSVRDLNNEFCEGIPVVWTRAKHGDRSATCRRQQGIQGKAEETMEYGGIEWSLEVTGDREERIYGRKKKVENTDDGA